MINPAAGYLFGGVGDAVPVDPADMEEIEFFIPAARPVPKGRPRFSRKSGFAFTPAKTRKAEESFTALAAEHRPSTPIEGAVQLVIAFAMPIPKSASKKDKAAMLAGDLLHTKRPDIDNLAKLVVDAMSEVFFVDDKQVNCLILSRGYSDMPGTHVIMRWENEEVEIEL